MSSTRFLIYGAVCLALMVICSWISIPVTIPFTLQTFAVFLTAALLGAGRALAVIGAYILLGAVGVPVFAGFAGGVGVVLGPTGGYMLGFPPAAAVAGIIMKHGGRLRRMLGMCAGLAVCYAFGTVWFMVVYAGNSGGIGLRAVPGMCVLPFVAPDLLKCALATLIADRLKRAIRLQQVIFL